MLKKILIIFFVLNLATACSRVSKKEERVFKESNFYPAYSKWELDKLDKELEEYKKINGYTPEVVKYRLLLEKREKAKEDFEKLITRVREELFYNDLTTLKEHMNKSLRSETTIEELEKIDFTQYRIFISKVNFENDTAQNIVALNTGEETFYFNVEFKYEKGMWELVKFQERR